MNKTRIMALVALGVCAVLSGCGTSSRSYFEVGPAAMRGEYDKVIEILEPDLIAGRPLDTDEMYMLCDAYYKVRQYKMSDLAITRFEEMITDGLTLKVGMALQEVGVYFNAFGPIFRARWYLDLGRTGREPESEVRSIRKSVF
jgi:hypothetical protein